MKVTGDKLVLKALEKYKKTAPKAVAAALYQEAVDIMSKSVPQVPVESGTLRRSNYITMPEDKGSGPAVELGYGTNYGVYVHERPANHPTGKAGFLRDPMNDAKQGFHARVLMRTKSNIDKGVEIPDSVFPTRPQTSKTSAGKSRRGKR